MLHTTQAYSAYQSAQVYDGMDPKRLILMLYDGALKHLQLAKEGIMINNPKKRGEHLGRVIAIVTELNASLDCEVKEEPIEFLRALYKTILVELPKVSVSNDVLILERVQGYISKLKEIWEKNVMQDCEFSEAAKSEVLERPVNPPQARLNNAMRGYGLAGRMKSVSFSV